MHGCDIALMFGKAVLRIDAIEFNHDAITRYLGNNRCSANGGNNLITFPDCNIRNRKSFNGIPIGASRLVDDKLSPQNSGNQIASAISKAAAFNTKTNATGVFATVNPTIMTGASMSGTGAVTGTVNINGFTTPMINTVLDNPRDSRIAAVNAINFIAAQTGIRAIDSLTDSKGIMLVADDGRNIEVTFNTGSTDADFERLTGLKQGVQTGTFSLESMVETPVNITTATNGQSST